MPTNQILSESEYFIYFENLLKKEGYEEFIKYLTDTTPNEDCRHLTYETLLKYKIGLGYETFSKEEGGTVNVPVVYFPYFIRKSDKQISTYSKTSDDDTSTINSKYHQVVKAKVRGIKKENKCYMRLKPGGIMWYDLLLRAFSFTTSLHWFAFSLLAQPGAPHASSGM